MLKKNWQIIYTIIVLCADLALFNLALWLAIKLRFPNLVDISLYKNLWVILNLLFFPLSIVLGLYRKVFLTQKNIQLHNLKRFTLYLGLLIMSYLFLIKGHEFSRGVVVIFLMIQYILLEISHTVLYHINQYLLRKGFGSRPIMIVGSDETAKTFGQKISSNYPNYYNIVGYVKNGSIENDDEIKAKIIGNMNTFEELVKKNSLYQVFVVSRCMDFMRYENVRLVCEKYNVPLKMVSPLIYDLMENARLKDVTGVPLNTLHGRYRIERMQSIIKRILDISIVTVASVLLVPIGALVAILIKLTSPGPVFFKQQRALSKGDKPFLFYKFRTMYNNADEIKQKLLSKNESNGALFKLKNDPRITPFGRFLRKYSLDEIPQFINVVKGDMSIVGPRPLPLKDYDMIKNGEIYFDWYRKRNETKPGITGLWQISGRSDLSFEDMCLLDLYYIENKSILLDLEIMFETVPVLLFGKGAY